MRLSSRQNSKYAVQQIHHTTTNGQQVNSTRLDLIHNSKDEDNKDTVYSIDHFTLGRYQYPQNHRHNRHSSKHLGIQITASL